MLKLFAFGVALAAVAFTLSVGVSLTSFWTIDKLVCQPRGQHYAAHGGCQ